MFKEYPKALYKGGKWDGESTPDCVTVQSAEEEKAAAPAYLPLGAEVPVEAEPVEPVKRGPGRPKKEQA